MGFTGNGENGVIRRLILKYRLWKIKREVKGNIKSTLKEKTIMYDSDGFLEIQNVIKKTLGKHIEA